MSADAGKCHLAILNANGYRGGCNHTISKQLDCPKILVKNEDSYIVCRYRIYAYLPLHIWVTLKFQWKILETLKIKLPTAQASWIPGNWLGQGLGNALGMAISEQILRQKYGKEVFNHHTYVIAGDGCLMEE